jgi:hypothetical protein
VTQRSPSFIVHPETGATALHVAAGMFGCHRLRHDAQDVAEYLLTNFPLKKHLEMRDKKRNLTPLIYATIQNLPGVAAALIRAGADQAQGVEPDLSIQVFVLRFREALRGITDTDKRVKIAYEWEDMRSALIKTDHSNKPLEMTRLQEAEAEWASTSKFLELATTSGLTYLNRFPESVGTPFSFPDSGLVSEISDTDTPKLVSIASPSIR